MVLGDPSTPTSIPEAYALEARVIALAMPKRLLRAQSYRFLFVCISIPAFLRRFKSAAVWGYKPADDSSSGARVQVGATYYGGLPDKLAPTRDMVAVDTLSLPGASIIIYNNWPRVPTGTPAFIIRYCQIEARPLSLPAPRRRL